MCGSPCCCEQLTQYLHTHTHIAPSAINQLSCIQRTPTLNDPIIKITLSNQVINNSTILERNIFRNHLLPTGRATVNTADDEMFLTFLHFYEYLGSVLTGNQASLSLSKVLVGTKEKLENYPRYQGQKLFKAIFVVLVGYRGKEFVFQDEALCI